MNQKKTIIIFAIIISCIVGYFGLRELSRYMGQVDAIRATNIYLREELDKTTGEYYVLLNSFEELKEIEKHILSDKDRVIEDNDELEVLLKEQKQLVEELVSRKLPSKDTLMLLETLGIEDVSVIEADLMGLGSEVIGIEGVLGGTMQFYEVRLLNERWVYGTFEDGHIMGRGIYEYTIDDSKNIDWEIVLEYTVP